MNNWDTTPELPPLTRPQGLDGLKSMCRVKHDSHQFHSGGNRPCGPVIGEERVHRKTAAEIHLVCWSRAGLEQEVHVSNIMKNRSNVSAISISHSSPLLIQLITLLNSILILLYITVCRIVFIVYRLKHFHLQLPLQILIFWSLKACLCWFNSTWKDFCRSWRSQHQIDAICHAGYEAHQCTPCAVSIPQFYASGASFWPLFGLICSFSLRLRVDRLVLITDRCMFVPWKLVIYFKIMLNAGACFPLIVHQMFVAHNP